MIEVSVIVATARRPEYLTRLLESLCAQDLAPQRWEVCITIDGPDADTPQVLRRFADRLPRLHWVETPVRRGPGAARNVAWRRTEGPIVAMTDDDCEPRPDWLSTICREFSEDADLGGIIGRTVTDRTHLTPFSHYVENLEGKSHQTCNCAYRRSVLEQLHGFDERFPFSLEDTDLYCRARDLTRVEFRPGVEVVHPPREASVPDLVRSARKFEGDFIFYRKNPALYRSRHEGRGPLTSVLVDVAVKHVAKQILLESRWLARNPATFFRYTLAMLLFSLNLWIHVPAYAWRHRGASGTAGGHTAGAAS